MKCFNVDCDKDHRNYCFHHNKDEGTIRWFCDIGCRSHWLRTQGKQGELKLVPPTTG
jgi:hypothetical protein